MRSLLDALRGRKPAPAIAADEPTLVLASEVQRLRLDLEERERALARLKEDLERQRRGEQLRVDEAVRAQRERLLADAASPAVQLLTQAHLLEVDGAPVQAQDILAVGTRLVRVLEDAGLTVEGDVGGTVPFDPNRHEPLGGDRRPRPGQAVVVRFVGASHRGRPLRKAGVEPVES